jgi:SSS family solute:Na+ symporter
VTFATRPDDELKLLAFYRKVRPGGAWGPIARLNGRSYRLQAAPFAGWALAVLMIVALLFGVGRLVFADWGRGAVYLAVGIAAAFGLARIIARIDWEGQ